MAEQRTFEDVSAETWARLCEHGRTQHGTVYTCAKDTSAKDTSAKDTSAGETSAGDTCAGDTCGVATTRTIVGEIVLAYDRDPARGTVTYRIQRKPMLVAAAQIWSGIERAIGLCRTKA